MSNRYTTDNNGKSAISADKDCLHARETERERERVKVSKRSNAYPTHQTELKIGAFNIYLVSLKNNKYTKSDEIKHITNIGPSIYYFANQNRIEIALLRSRFSL